MNKVKISNQPFGPFPLVLVGAEVNGKPNYAPVGAYGVVSLEPVIYVSLRNSHYTTQGIKDTGYFSVNIPSTDMVGQTDYCGVVSGHKVDKSGVFTSFYDELGKAPMISECPINALCKVAQTIPMFDFEFFLGEIVTVYANENCIKDGKIDPININPMILMGENYWELGAAMGAVYREGVAFKKLISET